MSISQSLNNALSGLTANARMAEVASSNLSNALTEGYGARQLNVSAAAIGGQSAGVKVDGITRLVDPGIIGDRRLSDAALAGQERSAAYLSRVESLVGTSDDPSSLASLLSGFEGALINASGDPASDQRLGLALARLGDVTAKLQYSSRNIQTMRQEADASIAIDIETLNVSLAKVEELNIGVRNAIARNLDPSALIDQRQRAIDTIGKIVPVREIPRENGRVALMTISGEMLLDGPAATYDFERSMTITADMTFASTALDGISRDGVSMSPMNGLGKLAGGSLGAAFKLRDETLVAAQNGLDEIAADLVTRFANPAVDPTLTAGDPGLLTDAGAAHDPLDIAGLAQRISINASVDPAQGGALSRWRDGVNAVATGPTGNAGQLNRWIESLNARQSISATIPVQSASGQIARFNSFIGTERMRGDDAVAFSAARRDTLHQAELSMGVDTDAELQSLMRIEQAYAANAKVVQTISAMMQTLMEI